MQVIKELINALETSNMILTTYHSEQEEGQKKDLIKNMIDTNKTAIISGYKNDFYIDLVTPEEVELHSYVGIPENDYNRAMGLLEEMSNSQLLYKPLLENLSDAIILLRDENN